MANLSKEASKAFVDSISAVRGDSLINSSTFDKNFTLSQSVQSGNGGERLSDYNNLMSIDGTTRAINGDTASWFNAQFENGECAVSRLVQGNKPRKGQTYYVPKANASALPNGRFKVTDCIAVVAGGSPKNNASAEEKAAYETINNAMQCQVVFGSQKTALLGLKKGDNIHVNAEYKFGAKAKDVEEVFVLKLWNISVSHAE